MSVQTLEPPVEIEAVKDTLRDLWRQGSVDPAVLSQLAELVGEVKVWRQTASQVEREGQVLDATTMATLRKKAASWDRYSGLLNALGAIVEFGELETVKVDLETLEAIKGLVSADHVPCRIDQAEGMVTCAWRLTVAAIQTALRDGDAAVAEATSPAAPHGLFH